MRLRTKQQPPYGGSFNLDNKELGFVGMGTNFEMLRTNVAAYMKANGIPIGLSFEDMLEREVCLRYPQECENTDPRIPKSTIRLTLTDVMNGTRVLTKFKLAGSPVVSQEEAERRAAICARCSQNTSYSKPCSSICQELKDLMMSIVGARKTQWDDRLQACRICHCMNAVQIHIPTEFSTAYLTPQQIESFRWAAKDDTCQCWKGKALLEANA